MSEWIRRKENKAFPWGESVGCNFSWINGQDVEKNAIRQVRAAYFLIGNFSYPHLFMSDPCWVNCALVDARRLCCCKDAAYDGREKSERDACTQGDHTQTVEGDEWQPLNDRQVWIHPFSGRLCSARGEKKNYLREDEACEASHPAWRV